MRQGISVILERLGKQLAHEPAGLLKHTSPGTHVSLVYAELATRRARGLNSGLAAFSIRLAQDLKAGRFIWQKRLV